MHTAAATETEMETASIRRRRSRSRRTSYEFPRILEHAIKSYGGTQKELAARLGIHAPTISRLLKRQVDPSVGLCLKLAIVTESDPVRILIAAGKGIECEMIQRLFGSAAQRAKLVDASTLPRPNEVELIQLLRRMSARSRSAINVLIRASVA